MVRRLDRAAYLRRSAIEEKAWTTQNGTESGIFKTVADTLKFLLHE